MADLSSRKRRNYSNLMPSQELKSKKLRPRLCIENILQVRFCRSPTIGEPANWPPPPVRFAVPRRIVAIGTSEHAWTSSRRGIGQQNDGGS